MPLVELEDETKIFYEQYGAEEDFNLIFFHGWGVSSVWFSEIIPYIKDQGYRITIFDAPGHGRYSDKRQQDYTYEQLKADFLELLNKLNLINKPMGFLGWSAGGGIIQRFYTESALKSLIKCLIIIGGSYSVINDPITKTLWNSLLIPIQLGFSPLLIFGKKRLIKRISPLLALYWKKPVRTVSMWLQDLFLISRDVMVKELSELLKYDLKDNLKNIKVPTLIVAGRNDMVTPVKIQHTMHELIPNSELHLINDAGHLALVTHSHEINPIIVNFLRTNNFK